MPSNYVGINMGQEQKLEQFYYTKRLALLELNNIKSIDELRTRIWTDKSIRYFANEILDTGHYRFDLKLYNESNPSQIIKLDYIYMGNEKAVRCVL